MSGTVTTGRTINGHTYSDAPVDVKLGPNTFRIPANYLDSQIAPWPGEGVTLVIEWPDMTPTPPGARANPRTNDFRKEISVSIDYVDRVPIDTLLARRSSNEAITEADSVERKDPRSRLDLRVSKDKTLGLIPYAIDEVKCRSTQASTRRATGSGQSAILLMKMTGMLRVMPAATSPPSSSAIAPSFAKMA